MYSTIGINVLTEYFWLFITFEHSLCGWTLPSIYISIYSSAGFGPWGRVSYSSFLSTSPCYVSDKLEGTLFIENTFLILLLLLS